MKALSKLFIFFVGITLVLPMPVLAVDRTEPFSPGETIDPGAESVEPCGPLDENCFPSISTLTSLNVTSTSTLANILPGISLGSTPTITAVDSTDDVGLGASMDLGDDGFARIAYFDRTNDTIKYTRCLDADCSTKNTRTLDSTGDDFGYSDISLKIGTDDMARIAYHDEDNKRLKYLICNNVDCSSPTIEVVDDPASGNSGRFASLALDSLNNPSITFHKGAGNNSGGNLILARFVSTGGTGCTGSTSWKCTTVAPLPYDAMLVLGNDGFPRIAYNAKTNSDWDGEELHLIVCADSDCISNTNTTVVSYGLTGTVGEMASIAIKSNGNAAITYLDNGADHTTREIKFLECTNALCTTSNSNTIYSIPEDSISPTTFYRVNALDLVLSSNETARVLVTTYRAVFNGSWEYISSLNFVSCLNTACSSFDTQTLDTFPLYPAVYPHQTMMLGNDGFPRIAYYKSNAGDLNYIRLTNDSGAEEVFGSSIGTEDNPFKDIFTVNLSSDTITTSDLITTNLTTAGLSLTGNFAIGTTTAPTDTLEIHGTTASFNTAQDGSLTSWSTGTGSNSTHERGSSAIANGYLYAISGINTANVEYAKLNSNGSVGSWSNTTSLPEAKGDSFAVVANGYLYVVAGGNFSNSYKSTDVLYAKLNSNGTIGAWNTNSIPIPQSIGGHTSVVANGYLYVIGGENSGGATANIYYAKLNADGSTGNWTNATNFLSENRAFHTSVVANGYLYVIGGINAVSPNPVGTVYKSRLNSDGSLGSWSLNSESLPDERYTHGSVAVNGHIYAIAGSTNDTGTAADWQSTVFEAKINSDGTTGTWSQTTSIPQTNIFFGTSAMNGYIYVVGGYHNFPLNTVYYASTARVTMASSLDLLSLTASGGTINGSGDIGGSILAGNIFVANILEVSGNTQLWNGLSVNGPLRITGTAATTTSPLFSIYSSADTNLLNILSTGEIGIGTTTPWKKFSVAGGVALSGLSASGGSDNYLCLTSSNEVTTGAACPGSSERFKHNVETLSSNLDEVMKLRPVTFEYNDVLGTRVGFIAEEVNIIDPRLVFYDEDGMTPRGVRYQDFVPLLAGAIQEQQFTIDDLEKYVGASTTDSEDESLYTGGIFVKFIGWFGNIKNKIEDFFAKSIHTETLCVGTENDETCITKQELDNLLNNSGTGPSNQQNQVDKVNTEENASSSDPVIEEAVATSTEPVKETDEPEIDTGEVNNDTIPEVIDTTIENISSESTDINVDNSNTEETQGNISENNENTISSENEENI